MGAVTVFKLGRRTPRAALHQAALCRRKRPDGPPTLPTPEPSSEARAGQGPGLRNRATPEDSESLATGSAGAGRRLSAVGRGGSGSVTCSARLPLQRQPRSLLALSRRPGNRRAGLSGTGRAGGEEREAGPRGLRARAPGTAPLSRARCPGSGCKACLTLLFREGELSWLHRLSQTSFQPPLLGAQDPAYALGALGPSELTPRFLPAPGSSRPRTGCFESESDAHVRFPAWEGRGLSAERFC